MTELTLAGLPGTVGVPLTRLEDDRLLTGRGTFVPDVRLPGLLDIAIVRSELAHARVLRVDASAARDLPGVIGVFTGEDLVEVRPYPDFFDWARPVGAFPLAGMWSGM